MALCNKLGSMLRSTVSASRLLNAHSSMLTAVRCMSSNLFVGGLSYNTTKESLKDAFSAYGDVVDARVILDRESGKSRGFGFVNFSSEEAAKSAQSSLDGAELDGRVVGVRFAEERPPRNNFGGGGGYGNSRGGFGNSGASNDY